MLFRSPLSPPPTSSHSPVLLEALLAVQSLAFQTFFHHVLMKTREREGDGQGTQGERQAATSLTLSSPLRLTVSWAWIWFLDSRGSSGNRRPVEHSENMYPTPVEDGIYIDFRGHCCDLECGGELERTEMRKLE